MWNWMRRLGWAGVALGLMVLTRPAIAQTQMKVEAGWGGLARGGHWNPILVTITYVAPPGEKPEREAHLELHAPHDNAFAMRIHAGGIVIGPKARTYMLLAPLNWDTSGAEVILRAGEGGTELKRTTLDGGEDDESAGRRYSQIYDAQRQTLIGVSGKSPAATALESADIGSSGSSGVSYGRPGIKLGFMPEAMLPEHAIGYDALAMLMLNKPTLGGPGMKAKELAILEWVRGGGRLVLWLNDGDVPADSPLAAALPCTVGSFEQLGLSEERLRDLGLPRRYAAAKHRVLTPKAGADAKAILGSSPAKVVSGRYGFGHIAVVSVDAGDLPFEDSAGGSNKAWQFWKPIFQEMLFSAETESDQAQSQRRATATDAVMDRLGDVAGAGKFDFTYPALVLLGMMFIVGPVDWFVLKKLGLQPWTWATTSGWIVLITVGALYIGHVVKSGDLHYRTLRLIDEADGASVAQVDMAMIYAPRTDEYAIATPSDSWWEPANTEANFYYGGSRVQTTIHTSQDGRGNTLRPMTINVWNLRCVRGESRPAGAAVIEASLRREGRSIVGTITNRGKYPLTNLQIRSMDGVGNVCVGNARIISVSATTRPGTEAADASAAAIPPGHTAIIDAPLSASERISGEMLAVATDLAMRRSERIDRRIRNPMFAVIYAESESDAAVPLDRKPVFEKHWQVVRALVELKESR